MNIETTCRLPFGNERLMLPAATTSTQRLRLIDVPPEPDERHYTPAQIIIEMAQIVLMDKKSNTL